MFMIITLPLAVPRSPNRLRLTVGLALSVLAHIAAMTAIRPMSVAFTPSRSLQVEILDIALPKEARTVVAPEANFSPPTDAATPPSHTAKPQPAQNTPTNAAAGIETGLAPARYYTSREVGVRAAPLNDITFVYPQLAYQNRIRGRVALRILINERGEIDDISVVESEPRGVFDDTALGATKMLAFSPAIRDGRPVKSEKTIEIVFDPYESIHIP